MHKRFRPWVLVSMATMLFVLISRAGAKCARRSRFQMSIDFSILPCLLKPRLVCCSAGRVQTCLRMACARQSWVEGSAQKRSFPRLLSECPRGRIGPSGSRAGPSSFFAATLQRRGKPRVRRLRHDTSQSPWFLGCGLESRRLNRGNGDGTHGWMVTEAEAAAPGLDGPGARPPFLIEEPRPHS